MYKFKQSSEMIRKSSIFILLISFIMLFNPICCFHKSSQGWTSAKAVLKQQVFVDIDNDDYYSYKTYIQDQNFEIYVTDESQAVWNLQFNRNDNQLRYIDAYRNFIVVQQICHGASVSYWVIQIIEKNDKYMFSYFPVNSRNDDQGSDISFAYHMKQIFQYDEQNNLLYVIVDGWDLRVLYKINIAKQSSVLVTWNWFYYNKQSKQNMVGGNSKVYVQAINDQIWIDSNNTRANDTDPTVYYKNSISKYTKNKIYPGGSNAFNLIGWYFQYISESDDHCRLTAFVMGGYKAEQVSGDYAMTSSVPFKYFSDGYNFFIAISSDDVYLTNIYVNKKGKYDIYSNLLSRECRDYKWKAQAYADYNAAVWIVYHNEHFYLLTNDSFIVYGRCDNYFKKKYEQSLNAEITCNDDYQQVIQSYMSTCKGKY